MPDRDDPCEIQFVGFRKGPDEVSGMRDVLKGARPAPAAIAQTSVFDISRGDASLSQRGRYRPHVVQSHGTLIHVSELRDPTSSMDDDRNWMRTLCRRYSQLTELKRIRSICESPCTRRNLDVRKIDGTSGLGSSSPREQQHEKRSTGFHAVPPLLEQHRAD